MKNWKKRIRYGMVRHAQAGDHVTSPVRCTGLAATMVIMQRTTKENWNQRKKAKGKTNRTFQSPLNIYSSESRHTLKFYSFLVT